MSDEVIGILLIALLGCIWALAHAIRGGIRRRLSAYAVGVAMGPIIRPVMVLGRSFALLWFIDRFPRLGEWNPYLRAWITLWQVLLIIGGIEAAALWVYEVRRRQFPVPTLLRSIGRGIVALAVAFALLKYSLGADISPLLASTALLTAVVGFALQGMLGNLMSGKSLHLVRSVVPGDWYALMMWMDRWWK